MKKSGLKLWRSRLLMGVTLATVSLAGLAVMADPPRRPAEVQTLDVTPHTALSRFNLVELARQGRFERILELLKSDETFHSDPKLAALVTDLETYRQHQEMHRQQRLANYEKARGELTQEMEKGRLDVALIKAIDAHSQSQRGQDLLADPQIVELVEKSKAQAEAAQKEGNWLIALTLWRNLDLLYLEDSTFHDQVKNAELHMRILRLYAPEELQRLHIQREAARGNPTPEPLMLGSETWQDRLASVRAGMIYDAMREAKNRHIDNPSYAKLLHGSIVRLTTLVESKGLAKNFPSLADTQKLADFEAKLKLIDEDAAAQAEQFGYRQLIAAVGSVLETNKATLNLPEEILIFEMTEGAMAELDPFSAVIWPHDLAQFSRTTEGKFSGVGIQISRPGRLTANEVTPDSPAAAAGIQAGDVIVAIADKDTANVGLDEAKRLIRTAETQVIIKVNRPGQVETLNFTLTSDGSELGLKLSRPGRLTVVTPIPGTPAHRAGIKPNDRILSVNDQDTSGWSLDQAVREITGLEGSKVKLVISRPGVADPITFSLTRSSIEMDSIRGWQLQAGGAWDYYIDRQRQIGYIRLSQFIPQSSDELDAAFAQMNQDGRVQAVILDLRYNPGGLLRKAADVVDRFVRSGRIVSTVNSEGKTTSQYSARPFNTLRSVPMVILINQSSASASEIVSGALQDYDAALIVGQRSYGKGSVQDLTPIDDKRAVLKLTTQYYRLPSGRIIHRRPKATAWGIEPDLTVTMTEQEAFDAIELRRDLDILYEPGDVRPDSDKPAPQPEDMFTRALDPQLEAALMYLRVKLANDTYMASRPAEPADAIIPPTTP